jgi:phosphoribosylformylglycinamidine synthase
MHDCAEGGIGVACAEMAFSGGLGMEIFLRDSPLRGQSLERNDFILFSESNSRFVVEVEKKNQKAFEKTLNDVPFGLIGCISNKKEFKVYGLDGKACIKADIDKLKEAWQRPLRW